MIGVVTKFSALEALRKNLAASSNPDLNKYAALISDHESYAHFGALGTAIGDFLPIRLESAPGIGSPGANPYVQIWKFIFNIFGGDETAENPGLKPILDRIRDLLSRLDQIAADEDLDALKDMESEIDTINQIAVDLTAVITTIKGDGTLANTGIVFDFATLISEVSKPPIIRSRPDGGSGFPARFWPLRDFLSWKRTGKFAKKIWDLAQSSDDDRLKAYALGWISSWSLSAGGASAVAGIIGAPYRNHWWRARFVSKYIDLWSFGHVDKEPIMTGHVPSPPYEDWPNLCEKELQKKLEIPGVIYDPTKMMKSLRLSEPLLDGLPEEITEFWMTAYNEVYGDLTPDLPKVDADKLQDAYAMAWLVVWFQTSKESLGCYTKMPIPSEGCGATPSWTDPTVPGDSDGTGVSTPPAPEIDKKIKAGNVVCAVILAILGISSMLFGGFAAGGAAIAGAIALANDAGTIDWNKLRCDLSWYRLYLYNGMRAVHDLLSLGGMVHPYTNELENDETIIELLQDVTTDIKTGKNILLSRPHTDDFPQTPSTGSNFSWFNFPSKPLEAPATISAISEAYPSGFINDVSNPLGNLSPFDRSEQWPVHMDPSGKIPGFMNSVDAVVSWLQEPSEDIPDWNLDGDRGLSHKTFDFQDNNYTNPVNIQAEP